MSTRQIIFRTGHFTSCESILDSRIGCYLTVRNIILSGLDTASRSKIAFVHASAESGIFGEEWSGDFCSFLGILNDDSLTEILREEELCECD